MDDRPPFDAVRASFYLVAAVIGVHCVVVLGGVAFCWLHAVEQQPQRCADLRGQLSEALAAALSAALAFSGGFTRRPPKE